MSKYSGKCDFYDVICIWGEDAILNCDIYVGGKKVEANSIDDLRPYFGTIIAGMGISKEKNERGKFGSINLCARPYYEERKDEIRKIYAGDERMIKERCDQLDEFYGKYFKDYNYAE